MNQELSDRQIPKEAGQAAEALTELFSHQLVGVYLYGSAVEGGLQKNSDVDIAAVVSRRLSGDARKELSKRLMKISGWIGNPQGIRSLEVTVLNQDDIQPWVYPPKQELQYGEWLRRRFEAGDFGETSENPDLAILVTQVRNHSVALVGTDAKKVFPLVPVHDLHRSIGDSLPKLLTHTMGDERNVLLTLARMWLTVSTGEIRSKDRAAAWAGSRLPAKDAKWLELAGLAYRGLYVDCWDGLNRQVNELIEIMRDKIESSLLSKRDDPVS